MMKNKILDILNNHKTVSLNADGNEDCIHQDNFEEIVDEIINLLIIVVN